MENYQDIRNKVLEIAGLVLDIKNETDLELLFTVSASTNQLEVAIWDNDTHVWINSYDRDEVFSDSIPCVYLDSCNASDMLGNIIYHLNELKREYEDE